MVGVADPCGMAQVGGTPAAMVWEIPGPETVQDGEAPGTLDAFHVMVEVCPARTRVGLAVMVGVAGPAQVPFDTETLAEQEPPAPVHVSVYAPAVETDAEPEGAPPVENPPPVQLVALVDDQFRVVGTVPPALVNEHVGGGTYGAATATFVHGPQLFP